ncbi:MAG TPA: ECF transporter S component, partial [Clostridium sp.]|nr:ECF transporter S component [Clostridium sp.]
MQGLLVALVTISTMVFQIPVSATQGYIHLGDSMILLISVFFGAKYGMVAGGVGSAMADLLSGYGHWAPFTFIIKGIMGYLIGKIASFSEKNQKFFTPRNMTGSVLGILWMV